MNLLSLFSFGFFPALFSVGGGIKRVDELFSPPLFTWLFEHGYVREDLLTY